jgi:putative addiction module CopG family antidote
MLTQHTHRIALTEPLVRYIGDPVAPEEYASASEVVRAGLRFLIGRDETNTAERMN